MANSIEGELLDQEGPCESAGAPWCPGGPAPWVQDPYDGDVNNTLRYAYLHDECAYERAMDI